MSLVAPNLIHLFLTERIYVVPQDRPKVVEEGVNQKMASEPVAEKQTESLVHPPQVLKSVPKVPAPIADSYALPKILPKSLVLLVHNPVGVLAPELEAMIAKLAIATEPTVALHTQLVGDLSKYVWPTAWQPWPARLTLLLGWPPELLARYRVAETFRPLRFGATLILAGPHPVDLEANRSLKAQLWSAIQACK